MRKFLLVSLLAWAALPVFAAQRVTVEQLEQVLAASHGKPDAKVAEELSGLELTERLSTARLARWEADVPGPASRQSLVVLADVSAFLDPPAAEIPATATPALAEQRRIIALAAVFAKNTISKLPNFFAARQTTRFEDTPGDFRNSSAVDYQPLHLVDSSRDTVLYRNGQEVVDLTAAERKKYGLAAPGLSTSGVFGPMLATVLMDTAQGTLAWGHWEQGAAGPEAVFRYEIPREKSHYQVELSTIFQDHPAYHGEFAVDPANGEIVRLKIEADMKPDDPVARSAILVEYGPVEIGGKTYICPAKSVAIETALGQAVVASAGGRGRRSARSSVLYSDMDQAREHLRTSVNDVVFEQYHLFRADARVLTGDNAEPAGNPPAASPEETTGAGPVAAAEKPVETVAAEESAPLAAAAPPLPAAPVTATAPAPSPAQPAAAPHPAVESSAGTLPAPTLRVTSRIVYVDVVVRDHQGHIVHGLAEDDFRVSEDGAAQKVDFFRAFTHEDSAAMDHSTPSASARGLDLLNPAASAASAPPDTINMILFDMLDTSLANQTYARTQMLKFLGELPPGHKIALFILTDRLRMIQNVTGNSELLVEAARLLLPRAARLFQSGSEQMRSADILGMLPGVMTGSGMTGGDPESFAVHLAEEMEHENAQNDQMRNGTVNNAFRELAQSTAAFNGRKNLFWLSESFPLGVLKTLESFQFSAGSRVAMTGLSGDSPLSGARIAVYPISVLGLETGGVTAAMNGTTAAGGHGAAISGGALAANNASSVDPETTGGVLASQPGALGGERMPDTLSQQTGAREALRDQMEAIAAQTGGEAFVGTNDVAGALRRSLEGGENYYSLVYTPTNKKWNGKFRKIEVKLARKGYTLSYRQGYVALPEPGTAQANTQK